MNRHLLAIIPLAVAVCAAPGLTLSAERIQPADFQRLHDLIRPHADEARWTQIPWLASLWDARKQAAREGKPILLWEMDGNPLGCT